MSMLNHVSRCFDDWMAESRSDLLADLCELVAIPTHSPLESNAFTWLAQRFEALGADVRQEPLHDTLVSHPAANQNTYLDEDRKTRCTLNVRLPSCGGVERILFSAHVDVVPGGPGFEKAFLPEVKDRVVTGRGTADTKGNIVMLLAALRFLKEAGLVRRRDVEIDFVIEEEIGGNGALSTLLYGREADAVIVLEPTSLEVFHGHRGCLEFTTRVQGQPVHQGAAESGVSAIKGAIELIGKLGSLEEKMVDEARNDPDFCSWERPLQVNIGTIGGGEWPGTLPEFCIVGGTVGFLPSYSATDIRHALEEICQSLDTGQSAPSYSVVCEGIHNEGYRGDPYSNVAKALRRAVEAGGIPVPKPRAWNVSCDARLYHHFGGFPTVVFGAGDLMQAHSSHEHLTVSQWERGVRVLAAFLADWETL